MRELRFVITPFCNYKCFFCHSESITNKIALYLNPSDYEFMAEVAVGLFKKREKARFLAIFHGKFETSNQI